jgi:predicted kinase
MMVTLLCGLSFSGKSTLARGLADELGATVLSLDAINAERGLDGGQGIPGSEWVKTNEVAHERVATALREGRQVVVDDTGSPRFIRDRWRETAKSAGARFSLVWVQIDRDLQLERVRSNRGNRSRPDVIDEVLNEHRASFEAPTPDESAIVVDARLSADPERIRSVAQTLLSRL